MFQHTWVDLGSSNLFSKLYQEGDPARTLILNPKLLNNQQLRILQKSSTLKNFDIRNIVKIIVFFRSLLIYFLKEGEGGTSRLTILR